MCVRPRTATGLILALAIGFLPACSPTTPPSGDRPSPTPSTIQPAESRSASPSASSPPESSKTQPSSATEQLLLPSQVRLQEGGDGLFPTCQIEDTTPSGFRADPGIWLNSLWSPTEYFGITILCLRGFAANAPILLTAQAGNQSWRTVVQPVSESPKTSSDFGYDEESPETLFNGRSLRVHAPDEDGSPLASPAGTLVSEMWHFLPPVDVRDLLATTGSLRLTAVQADTEVVAEQPVTTPTQRGDLLIARPGERKVVVLHGYESGSRVPIGLYRRDKEDAEARLIAELGTVLMPASRVSSFQLPMDPMKGRPPGTYCVLPPTTGEASCQYLRKWPDYPGQAVLGDRGDRVRDWQEILIAAGVMSDIPENHDGVYGSATEETLMEYLRITDHVNPDGNGVLGRGLYDLLTR